MPFERYYQVLNERSGTVNEIMDLLGDMDVEELEAVRKFCENYHSEYIKSDTSLLVTEITSESELSLDN